MFKDPEIQRGVSGFFDIGRLDHHRLAVSSVVHGRSVEKREIAGWIFEPIRWA